MDAQHSIIHGSPMAYRIAGKGPAVVLIHGMAGSSATWEPVIAKIARNSTVIAPDLRGHGGSGKERGDYSLGALAASVRDLLVSLGHERATIVGQSLGGGIAMQFAYQFPERTERLVLVSSGGLGPEVSRTLRALSIPGAEYVLAAACARPFVEAGTKVRAWLGKVGLRAAPAAEEMWRAYASLSSSESRAAFICTLRNVIDATGQRVSARDRLYLASQIPTLIVWGDADRIIPVSHAYDAHATIAASRLEIIEGCGHFPHAEAPEEFARVLNEFIASTEAASVGQAQMRDLMREQQRRAGLDSPS